MLLSAKGLSKRYGRNEVLRQASFRVLEHEVVGLIGPNGAGKTTLFEVLAGLIPADSGEVQFQGKPLAAAQRKHALFYLPDGIRPWEAQPVRWTLGFFESLYHRPAGEGLEFARALQLDHLLGARIGSLSKGEAKRAMLTLSLLTPHPLLLLDEPFDGLDFRQTREVMALLRTLPARGRTLFLSIHQLGDAARVCDRLVLLSRGQVVGEGALDELRSQANLPQAGLEEVFLALT